MGESPFSLETVCKTLADTLSELDRIAPGAPLLALGQTVFWDEPMKAGIALASNRKFVAGVHDSDYFAKHPGEQGSGFKAFPHNDTKTKGLWSAAAEFSALFGSETVVTKEAFQAHGLRIEKVTKDRPNLMDKATEAFGWRGIVALADQAPITAEVQVEDVIGELRSTLQWAIETTLECVSEPERILAKERSDHLLRLLDDEAAKGGTLADLYERLLAPMYSFVAAESVNVTSTRTTHLLRFNSETCTLPRFDLVDLFVCPETSELAKQAYNDSLKGSEIYGLGRFMSGALPFDLIVPGHGRGTLRIAPRGIVIMTPTPLFISLKKPVTNVKELAQAIESKFGPDCTLVGKAVTLIGMLSREFVFVFHEGASSYVKRSRAFHQELARQGHAMRFNPILRVRYRVWDALAHCYSWLRLPEPLRGPFGVEEICAPSFSARWNEVRQDQIAKLAEIANCRKPIDLIRFLKERASASWDCLSSEYHQIHDRLAELDVSIDELRTVRRSLYKKLRGLKAERQVAERKKGEHWRVRLFEKEATPEALAERAELTHEVERIVHDIQHTKAEIKNLLIQQRDLARAPDIVKDHERRRGIELEAELKRMKLIREGIITSRGLAASNLRPSAWWYPLLCPDGGWFNQTIETAETYLEPMD